MLRDKFTELQKKISTTAHGLCQAKGDDYATEDVLSNFKRMNVLCQTLDIDVRRSPSDCARFLLMLKIDRRCNLARKGKKPENESVFDTILDLHNYVDLAYACEIDSEEK